MIDSMKVKRSIYFATLQGYVIFETELYMYNGKHSEQLLEVVIVLAWKGQVNK